MALTAVLVASLLGAITIRSEPAALQLRTNASARIEVALTDADAASADGWTLTLTATPGSMGPVTALGGGRFEAAYKPPSARYPQVALVLAELKKGSELRRAWLGVPLLANEVLKLTTKPSASVKVEIAGKVFGPATANGKGDVELPVIIPPGHRTARMFSVDKVGNSKEQQHDLAPPPFALVRFAPPQAGASWAKPALPMELFAIDPFGRPRTDAGPPLEVDRGKVSALKAHGSGVYSFSLEAPEQVGSGEVRVRAKAQGYGTQVDQKVPVLPGPAKKLELSMSATEYVAGSAKALTASARAFDAKGNPASVSRFDFSTDLGTASADKQPSQATISLVDQFNGRHEATVKVSAEGLSSEAKIALKAGPPRSGQLSLALPSVRAGSVPTQGRLTLTDSFGNPVSGAQVQLEADKGQATSLKDHGDGSYSFNVEADPETAPGASRVRARAGEVTADAALTVLPYQANWGLALGLHLRGHSNFVRATGGSPLAEVAVRAGVPRVEALFRIEWHQYGQSLVPRESDSSTTQVQMQALALSAGARINFPQNPQLAYYLTATGGGRNSTSTVALTDGPVDDLTQSGSTWEPFAVTGAGVSYLLGAGRLLGELDYIYAPVSGQLRGNAGGAAVSVGYVIDLL